MKFKPNIKDIITEYGMDPMILIPKNSSLKEYGDGAMKRMKVSDNDPDIELIDTRGEDVPFAVEEYYRRQRQKPLGFTGDDLFDEYQLREPDSMVSVIETIDWVDKNAMFGRPALCLMTREGEELDGEVEIAVNKKYALTSQTYLEEVADSMNIIPSIVEYAGGTEEKVQQGLADAAIDIVASGGTVKRNGLKIQEVVRTSDYVLIGVDETNPKVLMRAYKTILDRVNNPVEGSYTSMLAGDVNRLIKKAGEENAEFIQEVVLGNSSKNLVGEVGDALYVSMIALARKGVSIDEVIRQEYRRMKL